jgi:predicted aconitase with swiveling domain
MEKVFHGRVVVPGEVKLKALVSHKGFNTLASYKNCKKGKNICTDQDNTDCYGKSTVGVALCLPQTIGSTTGGMVLFNAAVIDCHPGAMLFSNPIDSLAAAGVILASVWTPNNIPTVDGLGDEFLDYVKDGMTIHIKEGGEVVVSDA